MSGAAEHYERLLGPIYLWMAGGAEAALAAGGAEIEALGLPHARGASVVDLGAGFGMHAVPLARRGARVTAVDSSAELLRTLERLGAGLAVRAVEDDLLRYHAHIAEAPSAILCMGDTIAHLPGFDAVDELCERVAIDLAPGGVFVASFRDYTVPLTEERRFIPVRSDEHRILTCFLEYEQDAVRVHDIVHERAANGWQTRVSSYRKLRLAPERLAARLGSLGFHVRRDAGINGMVRLVARKAA